MSGTPGNPLGDPLGNLIGGALGTGYIQAAAQHQAASQQGLAQMASLAQQVAQASYPPDRPSMTGTEFIKASLRVAMEREMRMLMGSLIIIAATCMVVAVFLGLLMIHVTNNAMLALYLGFPAYGTAFVLTFYIRKRVKKWIEVHLS